ncbi:MAG: DUF169 domain-containing protein [Bacteroidales bacterium]|nr:DUF169 domain-containing protein [Bacteroidales bacterium]
MKFCEAVSHSFNIPLQLDNTNLGCPGARRCIGFDDNEKQLAKTISENNKIPHRFIEGAFHNIPRISNINTIVLGMTEFMEQEMQPDMYIVYVEPYAITTIMHTLARHAVIPSMPPYSLLSVCGNIFSNCYLNKNLSISFGCPESRRYGGIEREEVVMGIPYTLTAELIRILQ